MERARNILDGILRGPLDGLAGTVLVLKAIEVESSHHAPVVAMFLPDPSRDILGVTDTGLDLGLQLVLLGPVALHDHFVHIVRVVAQCVNKDHFTGGRAGLGSGRRGGFGRGGSGRVVGGFRDRGMWVVFHPVVIVFIDILAFHIQTVFADLGTVLLGVFLVLVDLGGLEHGIGVLFKIRVTDRRGILRVALHATLDFVVGEGVFPVILPPPSVVEIIEGQGPRIVIGYRQQVSIIGFELEVEELPFLVVSVFTFLFFLKVVSVFIHASRAARSGP